MNGMEMMQPRSAQAALRALFRAASSSQERSVSRPQMGYSTHSMTSPPSTRHCPPPISIMWFTAVAMSSKFVPMTITLWLSCPTEEAMAPLVMWNPPMNARPTLPFMP